MRFQVWVYKVNGSVHMIVRDRAIDLNRKGSVLARDQSIYPQDGGKIVWKNASYPQWIMDDVKSGKGRIIAESDTLMALDANINHSVITHLWETKNGINPEEL